MMNVISGNDAVPVTVKNNSSENAENLSAQESFMDTMQQIYSQSGVSADESENKMPVESDKPSEKTDSDEDNDNENYQSAFENMFFVYSPVTYVDLSELSQDTEKQKSIEIIPSDEIQESIPVNKNVMFTDEIQQDISDTAGNQSSDETVGQTDNSADTAEINPSDVVIETIGQTDNFVGTADVNPSDAVIETIGQTDNSVGTADVKPSDAVIETIGQTGNSADTADVKPSVDVDETVVQINVDAAEIKPYVMQDNVQFDVQAYAADNSIVSQTAEQVSAHNNDIEISDSNGQPAENLNNENTVIIPEKPVSDAHTDKNFNGNSNDYNENGSENNAQENPFVKENAIKSDFYKNINQVKEFMKDNAEKFSQTSETDISQLEKNVQQFSIPQFQTFSANQAAVPQQNDIYSPAEILSQTSESIISNVNNGSDEFTVVLNPEGLGKITVTILKGDVSNVLSLTVSNPKTAEILSSDINSLNQALRNLDIEFADIHIENSQESAQYEGYQQQYEREDAENSHNKRRNHHDDWSDEEDDFILDNEQLEAI